MDHLNARIKRIGQLNNAKKHLEESVNNVARISNNTAPRRTGRLKSSMQTSIVGLTGSVSYLAPYAWYVEEGTRFMAGRHFLKPPFFAERVKFLNNIRKDILD